MLPGLVVLWRPDGDRSIGAVNVGYEDAYHFDKLFYLLVHDELWSQCWKPGRDHWLLLCDGHTRDASMVTSFMVVVLVVQWQMQTCMEYNVFLRER